MKTNNKTNVGTVPIEKWQNNNNEEKEKKKIESDSKRHSKPCINYIYFSFSLIVD